HRARKSMRSMPPRWLRVEKTTASQVCVRCTTRRTTARSCSIPTGTTSRPFATARRDCAVNTTVLEHAMLEVRLGQEQAFEAAFAKAQNIISAMKGYLSHRL